MARTDKDRFLKELAIRFALARRMLPVPEVIVQSASDLSDSPEEITDIDVLGIEDGGDGGLRRTIFDCKSGNKLSAINRAFWAAGVRDYARCDEAYVILKNKAVINHRLSALSVRVDLHDEQSLKDLGATTDAAFPADDCYQASIERWHQLSDCYGTNEWASPLFALNRHVAPLTQAPWSVFRKLLAELRAIRGYFDPLKPKHVAIFLDTISSAFILWSALGRDIRRFYEPSMDKASFEKVLRYYLWGGREAYHIRQQIQRASGDMANGPVELPAWDDLVKFAGLVVGAPQNVFDCAQFCRELAIRNASEAQTTFDAELSQLLKKNDRIRQFSMGLCDYAVSAGGLPSDMAKECKKMISQF